MTVVDKIAALRAAMEAEGADGVYVPSSDPHMTEYLPARWRCRAWLSGFTGSAGTLCVTREAAALWTDGRYFIQAERQLEGSGITLMRMAQPGVPTVEAVSYTHLDVYKRQNLLRARRGSPLQASTRARWWVPPPPRSSQTRRRSSVLCWQ